MAPADVVVFKAGDGQRTNAARQARFRARQRLERWNAKQADHDARVTEARTRAAKYAAPDALETLAACIAEVAWVSMQCLASALVHNPCFSLAKTGSCSWPSSFDRRGRSPQ